MKSKSGYRTSRWGISLLITTMLTSLIPVSPQAYAAVQSQNQRQNENSTSHTITIDTSDVIQDDFLGVGVNTIPTALMPGQTQYGYTEAHWEVDKKRIQTIEPKVARVWFQIDWMEPTKGTYTWDSAKMKAFYKYLDAFKTAGTEIELNFGWKVGSTVHDWFTIPGIDPWTSAPADLDAYAASASALLEELIQNRGYDNVKYLTFYNEPNGSWDFEAPGDQKAYYAEMVNKTSARLTADGLRDLIEIWGPEETGAPAWIEYMKEHADDAIDGYSFHVYGESYDGLGSAFEQRKEYVGDKPLHLTEFGWADDNASNWDAGYANSVIQTANMGVKSALMWQLNGVWTNDPTGGTNGTYTMWDALPLGLNPRKTFYIAGMLNRYIPEHSKVLAVDTNGSTDVRAAAFRDNDGHYTVLVEAKAGTEKEITLDFGSTAVNNTIRKMVYKNDILQEPNAILPPVTATFPGGAMLTDSNVSDDYNVIIYTTQPAETQVKLDNVNPTVRSGDSITLGAEVIDNIGSVTWSVVGQNNGTINSTSGVYQAPQVTDETLIAVRATSTADPSAYGVVLVRVLPSSLAGKVEVPTFSLDRHVFPSSEVLYLETATSGAQIRYTTDGSEPTAQSSLYVRPIILNEGSLALYKAKAFKTGMEPSGTVSSLYQIGQISSSPDGYKLCMVENGGECYFQGKAVVAYGADGLFNYSIQEDGVACTSAILGDPIPGVNKRCYVNPEIPDELPVVTFFNAGFEKPATTSARPGPLTNGWVFDSRSGVQHNNGPFQAPAAPQGVQTGYLKTDGGVSGTLSQSIHFKPGTYQMSFKAAKRTSFGGTQSFDVYFDDQVIGSYQPESGSFETFRTDAFDTTGGKHTIQFVATTTQGDNTAFIDDVRITLPLTPKDPYIGNSSFESPAVTNQTGVVTGITADWSFNDQSGILRNGSSMTSITAPTGLQAAFVRSQNGVQGSFHQSVTFPAGSYVLNLKVAAQAAEQPQPVQIQVGGQTVGTITPSSSTYQPFTTDWFTVADGSHKITLTAAGTGTHATFIDQISVEKVDVPDQAVLQNNGFEHPAITSQNGVAVGSGEGWSFKNNAGRIRNGSVFGASDAPEGTQAAYLQTLNGKQGEFSQSLIFPAGSYVIQFQAAKRTSFGGQQLFDVYLDDQSIGSFTPESGSYTSYTSNSFQITKPGKHQIRFVGTSGAGDNTAFVDDILITPNP
ncbi:chitobiase/beta-hexosaminidase C-terminal domain-containing protein [Paenibacillus illinoisensis]|uniref:chitobiase/beta-hexosaminidase C-terminal domain-containing protein n=1 Tax=Paenibacillus illinoisensis TaxID=59845 RepID=UPI003CEBF4A7